MGRRPGNGFFSYFILNFLDTGAEHPYIKAQWVVGGDARHPPSPEKENRMKKKGKKDEKKGPKKGK